MVLVDVAEFALSIVFMSKMWSLVASRMRAVNKRIMLGSVDFDFAFVSFCCLAQDERLASESLELFRVDCFEPHFMSSVVH